MQDINFLVFHDACLERWQAIPLKLEEKDFLAMVESNHAFNYQLWLAEDRARREDKGHEFVYQAKREIDKCNQARNDRMEAMDAYLYETLSPALIDACPVHSETPGMMIDRLSILSLKIFHMAIQANRQEVDEAHRQICKQKYQTLCLQRKILHQCLHIFLEEIRTHHRTFCVYHQFKMYNDPKLNPELYA